MEKQRPKLWHALAQSGLVAAFVLLTFFAIYQFHARLAVASLAASAFIAFGFPLAESSHPRYLFGGSACGVVCGTLCCLARHALLPARLLEDKPVTILFCVAAVFLTAFLMLMLRLQHPPATALAISMVLEPQPLIMGLLILACVALLCGLRILLGRWLEKGKRAGEP